MEPKTSSNILTKRDAFTRRMDKIEQMTLTMINTKLIKFNLNLTSQRPKYKHVTSKPQPITIDPTLAMFFCQQQHMMAQNTTLISAISATEHSFYISVSNQNSTTNKAIINQTTAREVREPTSSTFPTFGTNEDANIV